MTPALYLLPVPLIDWQSDLTQTALAMNTLSPGVAHTVCQLQHFVVENAKTARSFIKTCGHTTAIAELNIVQMPRQPQPADVLAALAPLKQGHSVGILSEAGCPGIADPGAVYVAAAHAQKLEVRALVGPSSIVLALMSSGLDGQRFAFHGYAPVNAAERDKALQQMERQSAREQQTQVLIETPYRNAALFSGMLQTLNAQTRLCVACEVTSDQQWVRTYTVAQWKELIKAQASTTFPPFDKRPTVFCFLA